MRSSKMSLPEVDLKKTISTWMFFFKMISHWPFKCMENRNYYHYYVIANMLWYNLTSTVYLIKKIDDIEEVSSIIYIYFSTITCMLKVMMLHPKLNHIKDSFDLFSTPEFQPKNEAQKKILNSATFLGDFAFKCYFWLDTVTIALWMAFPILDNERRLPSKAWFPYDYLSKYYLVTYFWQCTAIAYVGWSSAGMDSLFAILMAILGGQCDCLCNQTEEFGKNIQDPEALREEFKKLISHHRLILKLVKNITDAFTDIILLQFVCCALTICQTMFMLSLDTSLNASFINLFVYLIALLGQLFGYCWFGNEVIYKSSNLYYSVFSSNWVECPRDIQKDLIFFMHRTQEPIVLFIGNIFPISISTFLSVVKMAWSLFTALQQMHDEDE